MSHYRKMLINAKGWRFNIGKEFVEIRSPGDVVKKLLVKKTDLNASAVDKLTAAELEANPNLAFLVTPAQIESFIRRTYPAAI